MSLLLLFPAGEGGGFPTQYAGLRVQGPSAMIELSLVAEANAPSGMGGVLKIQHAAAIRAAYLVDTGDPNASPVRIQTTTGTKSIRLKT